MYQLKVTKQKNEETDVLWEAVPQKCNKSALLKVLWVLIVYYGFIESAP